MSLKFDVCIRIPASMEKTYSSWKGRENQNICGFTYRPFMGNISLLPHYDLVILIPSIFRTATLRHWEILQILWWVEEPRLGLSLCFSITSEVRLPTVLRPVPAGTGHVHSRSSWGHWDWLVKTYSRSSDVRWRRDRWVLVTCLCTSRWAEPLDSFHPSFLVSWVENELSELMNP